MQVKYGIAQKTDARYDVVQAFRRQQLVLTNYNLKIEISIKCTNYDITLQLA